MYSDFGWARNCNGRVTVDCCCNIFGQNWQFLPSVWWLGLVRLHLPVTGEICHHDQTFWFTRCLLGRWMMNSCCGTPVWCHSTPATPGTSVDDVYRGAHLLVKKRWPFQFRALGAFIVLAVGTTRTTSPPPYFLEISINLSLPGGGGQLSPYAITGLLLLCGQEVLC